MGSDRYALEAGDVVEVLPLMTLKALPGAPVGVVGLADYRGTAVPAIDLSVLALGRPAERRASTRMLIVTYPHVRGSRLIGLIAERATEMITRAPDDFQPTNVSRETARFLGPVTTDTRGLIQRVDVRALLTDEVRAALYPDEAKVGS